MFLSRGDRDLGVAFQTHPGRQAFISSGSKEPRSALGRLCASIAWGTGLIPVQGTKILHVAGAKKKEAGRICEGWGLPTFLSSMFEPALWETSRKEILGASLQWEDGQ